MSLFLYDSRRIAINVMGEETGSLVKIMIENHGMTDPHASLMYEAAKDELNARFRAVQMQRKEDAEILQHGLNEYEKAKQK